MDRLSELPEPILHHILKFLPFEEVARTCVLSRKWEQVWSTYPIFLIDRSSLSCLSNCGDALEVREKRVRAIDSLEKTLRNRLCKNLISMEKLLLHIVLCEVDECMFVEKCLSYAIDSKVKTLDLDIRFKNGASYHLPSTISNADSIEVLNIGHKAIFTEKNIKLPCLKKLCMHEIHFSNPEFESILLGCSLLEELHISNCSGLRNIELFGQDRLKVVEISGRDVKRVDINLRNVNSLSVAKSLGTFEIDITNCRNLKELKLEKAVVKANRMSNIISELLELECLSLQRCVVGRQLKISSTSIERLEIIKWERWAQISNQKEGLVELEINTPNLSFFSYGNDFINLYSTSHTLSTIHLIFKSIKTIEEYIQLAKFLEKIHGCSEMLYLVLFYLEDKIFVEAEELRKIFPSPLFSCPSIRIYCSSSFSSITRIMDELLWIFPHTKTIYISSSSCTGPLCVTCKFSYKKSLMYEGEYVYCGKSYPLLCWEHCIDKVEVELIVYFGTGGLRYIKKHYCLKGAEFQNKMDSLYRQLKEDF